MTTAERYVVRFKDTRGYTRIVRISASSRQKAREYVLAKFSVNEEPQVFLEKFWK